MPTPPVRSISPFFAQPAAMRRNSGEASERAVTKISRTVGHVGHIRFGAAPRQTAGHGPGSWATIGTDYRRSKHSRKRSGMAETATDRRPLELLIAAPRGFCAGVDRAIRIVELAIEKHGAPVYVRHEIVHNKFVVDSLKAKGAVFVEELDEVPDGAPVVFSAHGVPKSVPAAAQDRGLDYLDATCPLVSKVHRQAERL
ncbi:hypothetical protein LTR94_031108, partial [Friedmanniomyces endolithicus]